MYKEEYSVQEYAAAQETNYKVKDLVYVIFRHKWKIIFVFLILSLLGSATVILQPDWYQSEVKILVNMREESLSVDPDVVRNMIGAGRSQEQIMNVELSILKSKMVAELVVDAIGPARILELKNPQKINDIQTNSMTEIFRTLFRYEKPDMRSRAVEDFRKKLEVQSKENVITITYMALQPSLTFDVLNELVQIYMERHIQVLVPEVTPQFFQAQSSKALAVLTNKEKELNEFKNSNRIDSLDDQKQWLISQIGQLRPLITELEAESKAAQATIEYLEKINRDAVGEKRDDSAVVYSSPTTEYLREEIVGMELELNQLQNRFSDNSRRIQDIKNQIQAAKQALEKEYDLLKTRSSNGTMDSGFVLSAFSPVVRLQEAKTRFMECQARLNVLNKDLSSNIEKLNELNDHEITYKRFQREIVDLSEIYAQYSESHRRSLLTVALETEKVSNLRVLQPPYVPEKIMKTVKEKYRNIALSLMIGFIGGLGLALASEFFDQTIRSEEDIEKRLGAPLLASFTKKEFHSCI